jgi:RNA polymerase sigma-70 factor (ECF subfamily)
MTEPSMTAMPDGRPRAQMTSGPPERLSVLLERIAAGEQAALAELYDLTVPKVFSLASFILRNSRDAEEIVCDSFAQVWRSARQYDRGRGSAMGWLLTICRSRAVDRRRRNRAAMRTGVSDGPTGVWDDYAQGPDDILQAFEEDSALYRALYRLCPLRRHLISLAFLQGLTHEEIARETGLAAGTVKSHIRRALAAMRAELGTRGRDGLSG